MVSLPKDKIICGNCLQVLGDIPESSVDLVFADPPYNLQLEKDLYRPDTSKVNGVDDAWDKFPSLEKYDSFTEKWIKGCHRVLKDEATIWVIGTYHNIFRIGTILQDLGFWILNDVIWIKNNPMPNFRGVRFTNAHETLIWAQKKRGRKYTFNHQSMKVFNDDLQMRSDWYLHICKGPERIKIKGETAHTAQKPEALLYRILLATTKPGDIVLDPFFGSGTTGVAAKKLGRHFIGIEIEKSYVQLARDRISKTEPGMDTAFPLSEPRQRTRIPFGSLLEAGLLQPGQILYFSKNQITAMILTDGSIRCGEITGSIHKVAKQLLKSPANGWEEWFYLDNDNQKKSIDGLRNILRKETGKK